MGRGESLGLPRDNKEMRDSQKETRVRLKGQDGLQRREVGRMFQTETQMLDCGGVSSSGAPQVRSQETLTTPDVTGCGLC